MNNSPINTMIKNTQTIALGLSTSFLLLSTPVHAAPEKAKNKAGSAKSGSSKAVGPSPSTGGSKYFHYVPASVAEGISPPALFWTGGGRAGNAKDLELLAPAAELTGTILIACGSSSNSGKKNGTNMHNNLTHVIKEFSLDSKRIFFSGASGGAARSLGNASHYKFAGAMPLVGYMPTGAKPPTRESFYYVLTGTTDYNRYGSALVAKSLGKSATLRIGAGDHSYRDPQALNDGLIWLYTRNAYSKHAKAAELAGFEERFLKFLNDKVATKPGEVFYWTTHMLETCKVKGANKGAFQTLHNSLKKNEDAVRYLEGREEIEDFGLKYYSAVGRGSKYKHTTPDIKKNAAKIAQKYKDIPSISKVASKLGAPTQK